MMMKVLTFAEKVIMPWENLQLFDTHESDFTKKVFIAGYKIGLQEEYEKFIKNPINFRELNEAMLCYQHVSKNMGYKY